MRGSRCERGFIAGAPSEVHAGPAASRHSASPGAVRQPGPGVAGAEPGAQLRRGRRRSLKHSKVEEEEQNRSKQEQQRGRCPRVVSVFRSQGMVDVGTLEAPS